MWGTPKVSRRMVTWAASWPAVAVCAAKPAAGIAMIAIIANWNFRVPLMPGIVLHFVISDCTAGKPPDGSIGLIERPVRAPRKTVVLRKCTKDHSALENTVVVAEAAPSAARNVLRNESNLVECQNEHQDTANRN